MYHPILKAVIVKWKDFATPEEYKKTIEFAYSEIVKRKCPHWVSDMTQGKAVNMASTQWLRNEFIPTMAKDGIVKKLAFQIDYNPLRKLFIDSVKESIQTSGVQFKCFKNRQEMEKWIIDMENLSFREERNKSVQYY